MTEPVKSPYWSHSKAEIVRQLDAVADPERYKSLGQYIDVLIKTAIRNPEQMEFYLLSLLNRVDLIRQVIADSKKATEEQIIKTDG